MSKGVTVRRIASLIIVGVLAVSFLELPLLGIVPSKVDAADAWWNPSWPYRKAITIDADKVDADLSNFPVLVSLASDSDLSARARSNGQDIVFTDASAVKLSHEIELYSSATGRLVAWIKIPSLSSAVDTVIYMYYGNPSAPPQWTPEAVWDSSFMQVHHLTGSTATALKDSTINNNDVIGQTGSPTYNAEAKIGRGVGFTPNEGLVVGDADTLDGYTSAATFEAWVASDNYKLSQTVASKWSLTSGTKSWFIEIQWTGSTNKVVFYFSEDGSRTRSAYCNFMFLDGAWYHIVVVWKSRAAVSFYINGVNQVTFGRETTASIFAGNSIERIGDREMNYFDGKIDEFRISNVEKSESWLLTSFRNQDDPSSFCVVGSPPSVVGHVPVSDAVDVSVDTSVVVTFSEAMDKVVTQGAFSLGSVVGSFSWNGVGTVMTFTPNSPLAYGTVYTAAITTVAVDMEGDHLKSPYNWSFTTESANAPPSVVGHVPVSDAVDVSVDTSVVVTFSEAMDKVVTQGAFSLGSVVGSFSWNGVGTVMTFTPNSPLAYDTIYISLITTDAVDLDGQHMASPYSWLFTTAAGHVPTLPTVTAHVPLNGALNVSVATSVQVTFSEAMDKVVTQGAFSLGSVVGSFSWNGVGTVMTFTPNSPLVYSTIYTATTTTDAVDMEGDHLGSPYSWSFTTISEPGGQVPPIHDTPILISSSGTDTTSEPLTCYNQTTYDPNGDPVTNVYNWYVNGVSLTTLLMPFGTMSATTAKDYSGYENHGSVNGATWTVDGKPGGAYLFNGASFIVVPDDVTLGGYGTWSEISIAFWLRPTADKAGAVIVEKQVAGGSGASYRISFRTGYTGNRISWGITSATDGVYYERTGSSSTSIGVDSWRHVVCTYDAANGLSIYVDGELKTSRSLSGNIASSSGKDLYIGHNGGSDPAYGFSGALDGVQLYRTSLTSEQVAQLYLETKDGLTINSTLIAAGRLGQAIKCQVTPNDGIADGVGKFSNTITVRNSPPIASDLKIFPRDAEWALDAEDLVGNYTYFDFDEHLESGTQIMWYKNNVLQAGLINQLVVPNTLTSIGEKWNFTVIPNDGIDFGTMAVSYTITVIGNNLPSQGKPLLLASDHPLNSTHADLACYNQTTIDFNGDNITNIYSWKLNDKPFTNLLMPFDTQTYTPVKDYSGYANEGINNGASWTSQGVVGGAYLFDGNDFIEVPDDASLGADGTWSEISIEFWIKVASPLHGTRIVAKKLATASTGSYMVGFQTSESDPDNTLFFGVTTGGAWQDFWDTTTTVLDVGVWYHVACTYKSGERMAIYINGTKRAESAVIGNIEFGTATIGDEPVFIGTDGSGAPNRFLNGTLDEVRIYSKALSAEQIFQRYLETRDGISNSSAIVSEETSFTNMDVWKCEVTPNDGKQDGVSRFSDALTVQIYEPFVSNEDPEDEEVRVPISTSNLSFDLFDYQGDLMNYTVATFPNIGSISRANRSGGTQLVPVSGLKSGTKYTWQVNATDGKYWTNKTFKFTTPFVTSKWTTSTSNTPRGFSGVLIADVVSSSPGDEIIFAGEGLIVCLRQTDGQQLWSYVDGYIQLYCQPQMADLDKDGALEVIVPLESPPGILVLRGNNGSIYWRAQPINNYGSITSSPVIGDIDGNGYPTIFVGVEDIDMLQGALVKMRYDGLILGKTWAYRPCSGGLSLADVDNDGDYELYMGDRVGPSGRSVVAFDAHTLATLWDRRDLGGAFSSHCPVLADVNEDGILDVVVENQRGGIYVLDALTGATMIGSSQVNFPAHYQPSVYDIDGDGNLEIMGSDGHHTSTPDDTRVWDLVDWSLDGRMETGLCVYPPQLGEVTGDGLMDIIACNYTAVLIFSYNAEKGTYDLMDQMAGLAAELNYAVVQDIDYDGLNEIVVANAGRRIYAFDTVGIAPTPRPRSEVQFYSERRLGAAEYVPLPGSQAPVVTNIYPPNGATDVTPALTELRFTLIDFQGQKMNYTVVTSPNIGSGSGTNVGNGDYTVGVSGLQSDKTYTWKLNVTDGTNWTNMTLTFTTQATSWYNSNWLFRKPIIIDPSKVTADQTGFPVLIDIADADLTSKAQADGDDILFTDINQVKLPHEIELYNSPTGRLVTWVKVPTLSSTTYTTIYMYYGNAAASNQQNPPAVWDTYFKEVHHLTGTDATTLDDSTENNNDVTAQTGTPGYNTVGKIGNSVEFLPNAALTVNDADSLDGYTTAATLEAWFLSNNLASTQCILSKWGSTGSKSWFVEVQSDKILFFFTEDGSTVKYVYANFAFQNGIWYHIVVVWKSNIVPAFYINGALQTTFRTDTTSSVFAGPANQFFGSRGYNYLNGKLDEVRISSIGRSASWILTSFNNQNDPSSFYTVQGEQNK